MKTLILTLAFACITGYIIHITSKHKAFKSISMSDYWLKYPWKWVFEAVMIFCGSCLIYLGFLMNPVIIGSGIGIIGVGIFARFQKNKFFKIMHYASAIGGFTSLTLSFIDIGYWYMSVAIAFVTFLTWYFSKRDNPGIVIWNVEIILIYCNFICLGIII